VVGPSAEYDFDGALLMARVAAATHDDALARSYFAAAHRLAGERWTPAIGAEQARIAGADGAPPRTIAGG
jgi:hypothetical protein